MLESVPVNSDARVFESALVLLELAPLIDRARSH